LLFGRFGKTFGFRATLQRTLNESAHRFLDSELHPAALDRAVISIFNQYVSVKSLLLIGLESVLIIVSLPMAAKLRFWNDPIEFLNCTSSPNFLFENFTVLLVLVTCCYYNDLYDLNAGDARGQEFVRLVQALGVGCVLLGLLYYMNPELLAGDGVLFIALVLAATAIGGMRVGLNLLWPLTSRERNVLILGDGETALTTARELERRADLNFRVVGFVTPEITDCGQLFGRPVLSGKRELCAIARDHGVSRIVVALEDSKRLLSAADLALLKTQGIQVEDAYSALAALTGRVWLHGVQHNSLIFSGVKPPNSTLRLKRLVDLVYGLFGIVLSSPVMALVTVAIRLESKGPVLYRQARVGLGGKVFDVLKFRSMRVDAEAEKGAQWAQEDDPRVTRVGRFIRKYRLDELPQFFNVIRGEMSFVGPRPERPVFVQQLRELIPYYDERHSVRPGVTGWAQVEYAYGASIEDALRKLEYDLFYLKSLSMLFDIMIVVRTVRVVLLGSGR
jgi:sugar transferase (PEP-CTERM system associated)